MKPTRVATVSVDLGQLDALVSVRIHELECQNAANARDRNRCKRALRELNKLYQWKRAHAKRLQQERDALKEHIGREGSELVLRAAGLWGRFEGIGKSDA